VSLPSWQNVGWFGQFTQGLFRPHPPSPQRRARLELVSNSSDHHQSTSAQGAGGSPNPPSSCGKQRHRGETRKRCFPEQTRIGAELCFPRRVSLSRMQLPEASFVPFLRWALAGSLRSWQSAACWGHCTQGFSGPICLLPEVEHFWSWFPPLEITCKEPVHRVQEESQTLLVPMATKWLGEKPESAAFLSKHALGLSLVSGGEFHFHECSC